MTSMRDEYRKKALALADANDFAEALVRIQHVLQWNEGDSVCLRERDRMRDIYQRKALDLAENGDCKEALNMLEEVRKWLPLDRDVFAIDRLEKIRRMVEHRVLSGRMDDEQEEKTTAGTRDEKGEEVTDRISDGNPQPNQRNGHHRDRGVCDRIDTIISKQDSTTNESGLPRQLQHVQEAQPVLTPPVPLPPMDAAEDSGPDQSGRDEERPLHPRDDGTVQEFPRVQNGGPSSADRQPPSISPPTFPTNNDRYPFWWESQACYGYVACILCGCRPCFCPQMFGRNVKEYELLGPFFALYPLVCGIFCVDYIISSCSLGKLIGPRTLDKLCLDPWARENCSAYTPFIDNNDIAVASSLAL